MNQLTVMLNGNAGTSSGSGHHHATAHHGAAQMSAQPSGHQFFTFQTGQSAALQATPGTISIGPDGTQHHHPQSAGHQQHHQLGASANTAQQLVTFQSAVPGSQNANLSTGTVMLSAATPVGSQAYSSQPNMNQAASQNTIQYFLTPTQQNHQSILTTATQSPQSFGLVTQNLLAPGFPIQMQPTLQSATNGTIQIPAQTIHNQLQPTFVTMNQPTGTATIQIQNPNGAMFQAPQQQQTFQLAPSAISLNSSHSTQLLATPAQPQFILNQPTNMINQPTPQQPIYQIVLSNGQVIQTMQPPSSGLIASPQIIQQSATQQATITVPIQTQTGPTLLTTPSGQLTLTPGQTFITTQQQTQSGPPNTSTQPQLSIVGHPASQQSPNLTYSSQATMQNGLLITTSNGTQAIGSSQQQPQQQQQSTAILLNTSPNIASGTNSLNTSAPTSLLIPAVSRAPSISNNNENAINNSEDETSLVQHLSQQDQQSNQTTAMVVLTNNSTSVSTAINSSNIIPSNVLSHKFIKNGNQKKASPKATVTSLVKNDSNSIIAKPSAPESITNVSTKTSSLGSKSNSINEPKSPLLSPGQTHQSTQCDTLTGSKLLEELQREEELAFQMCEQEASQSEESQSKSWLLYSSALARPPRPSSCSSCGSLKIDEKGLEEEGEERSNDEQELSKMENDVGTETEVEQRTENNDENEDTVDNDAFSIATELDSVTSVATENEIEMSTCNNEQNDSKESASHFCPTGSSQAVCNEEKETNISVASTSKNVKQEDKDGYQSSYGGSSPCHFTDTEDEEEEMEPDLSPETDSADQIKLVSRKGLTKAAFDLINNRILGSEDDNATNDSSKSGTTSLDASTSVESQCIATAIGKTVSADEAMEETIDDEKSNDSAKVLALQMQIPSPSSSIASSSGPMEPESTTQNWNTGKERTIINITSRFYNGIDLDPIREFAKRFKMYRLSLGLTQSQVCHDLSLKTDGQSYSQSAICRFEKLDITPKSAVKIKPVLENWMRLSTEKYRQKTQLNAENVNAEPLKDKNIISLPLAVALEKVNGSEAATIRLEPAKKRKRRTSFTPTALELLNKYFENNPKPNSQEVEKIAQQIHKDKHCVRIWFCNKRQAMRGKLTNGHCDQTQSTLSPLPPSPSPSTSSHNSNLDYKPPASGNSDNREQKSTTNNNKPTTSTSVMMVSSSVTPAYAVSVKPASSNHHQSKPPLIGNLPPQPLASKSLNTPNASPSSTSVTIGASTGPISCPFVGAVSAIPLSLSSNTGSAVAVSSVMSSTSSSIAPSVPIKPTPIRAVPNAGNIFSHMNSAFSNSFIGQRSFNTTVGDSTLNPLTTAAAEVLNVANLTGQTQTTKSIDGKY